MNYVCETVMAKLIGHKKPFKFVVTCMITQRTGAGVHSATSAHLDTVPKRSRSPIANSFLTLVNMLKMFESKLTSYRIITYSSTLYV